MSLKISPPSFRRNANRTIIRFPRARASSIARGVAGGGPSPDAGSGPIVKSFRRAKAARRPDLKLSNRGALCARFRCVGFLRPCAKMASGTNCAPARSASQSARQICAPRKMPQCHSAHAAAPTINRYPAQRRDYRAPRPNRRTRPVRRARITRGTNARLTLWYGAGAIAARSRRGWLARCGRIGYPDAKLPRPRLQMRNRQATMVFSLSATRSNGRLRIGGHESGRSTAFRDRGYGITPISFCADKLFAALLR